MIFFASSSCIFFFRFKNEMSYLKLDKDSLVLFILSVQSHKLVMEMT